MYNHSKIEKKWREIWAQKNVYKFVENSNKKFYVLDMFPYPSGQGLHVGHPKGYTATDIVARYKKMNGFDILHPIGCFSVRSNTKSINLSDVESSLDKLIDENSNLAEIRLETNQVKIDDEFDLDEVDLNIDDYNKKKSIKNHYIPYEKK